MIATPRDEVEVIVKSQEDKAAERAEAEARASEAEKKNLGLSGENFPVLTNADGWQVPPAWVMKEHATT